AARDAAERAREAAEEAADNPEYDLAGSGQGSGGGFLSRVRAHTIFRDAKGRYEAGDYRAAHERLVEALALDPEHDDALALLAWSEYFLGYPRAAVMSFKAALRRQPAWEGLYDGLGWSRHRLGRFHLAHEAFRTALDLDPDYVDAMIGAGSTHLELGRHATALPFLQTALRRLEPLAGAKPAELPAVRAKVGWALYHLGRHQEALGHFETAVQARPQWHGLHVGIGWCLLELDRPAEAREAFRRALALRRDDPDALEGLRRTGGTTVGALPAVGTTTASGQ
ncbi:MAG: tetratricopeptide repeat protein, partial [Candidatus Rokuibacteriota bacterium]